MVELPSERDSLEGLAMELSDCSYDCVSSIKYCTKGDGKAFEDADIVLLVGAKPRSEGMERADLLKDNARIFKE